MGPRKYCLRPQSGAEAQTAALELKASLIHEEATTEAHKAADVLLEAANTKATRIVEDAYSDARSDVAAVTRSMLKDDGKEFVDLNCSQQIRRPKMIYYSTNKHQIFSKFIQRRNAVPLFPKVSIFQVHLTI